MRLRIFQAGKGDALVLSSHALQDGGPRWTHVLVDGGQRSSYRSFMAHHLPELEPNASEGAEEARPELDLVVVTHIDDDHIAGVLQLTDDEVAWRVHAFRSEDPDLADDLEPPEVLRPPRFSRIWHNAFHRMVQDHVDDISQAIASMVPAFGRMVGGGTGSAAALQAGRNALTLAGIETSKTQAFKLSRRIGEGQLGLELNGPSDPELLSVETVPDVQPVGSLRLRVIGPFDEDLEKLRKEWQKWLDKSHSTLLRLRDEARRDEEDLGHPELNALALRMGLERSMVLGEELYVELALASGIDLATAQELGRKSRVTYPNRASIMLVVEEGDVADPVRMVLTGDGHHEAILAGLEDAELLDEGAQVHVDVLKVPHHGSEHNADEVFFRRVIADHYVFCANGAHENPDLAIVEALLQSRLGEEGVRSEHDKAGDDFTLWFSTAPELEGLSQSARDHLVHVRERIDTAVADSDGRVTAVWSDADYVDLEVSRAMGVPRHGGPALRLTAALANVAGPDKGNEWVELTAGPGGVPDLSEYELRDLREGGRWQLSGSMVGGEVLRLTIPDGVGIRLANSGGDILALFHLDQEIQQVELPASKEEEVISFEEG